MPVCRPWCAGRLRWNPVLFASELGTHGCLWALESGSLPVGEPSFPLPEDIRLYPPCHHQAPLPRPAPTRRRRPPQSRLFLGESMMTILQRGRPRPLTHRVRGLRVCLFRLAGWLALSVPWSGAELGRQPLEGSPTQRRGRPGRRPCRFSNWPQPMAPPATPPRRVSCYCSFVRAELAAGRRAAPMEA